jgi:hypothetical protein
MSVESVMGTSASGSGASIVGHVRGGRHFRPDYVVHITGVAAPVHGIGPWKELVAGLLRAFPDLHFRPKIK